MATQQAMSPDARLTVESRPIWQWRQPLVTASCAGCGAARAYANTPERAVTLALQDAEMFACCETWT